MEVPLAVCKCAEIKTTQRAGSGKVFSTAAEHFVQTLRNKEQEEVLAVSNTHVGLSYKAHHVFCSITCWHFVL